MRSFYISVVALSLCLTMCLPIQAQSDLKRKIEEIFLYNPRTDVGEKYNKQAQIEQLGSAEEVGVILLKMLAEHKHSEPGTLGYVYLNGSTFMLGKMTVKQATAPLTQVLFDRKVHENVRALAARSLGEIDAEASKEPLLTALANTSNYFGIRVEAAEAVAKTRDPQALKALSRYARQERDAYVKQKFEKAAQDMRARIRNRP